MIASADRGAAIGGRRLANGVVGMTTWLLPTADKSVEGIEAGTVELLPSIVSGRGEGTTPTTGIPANDAEAGICPSLGKLMDPPLPGNVPLIVVLAGIVDCAASFSSTTSISSWVATATADLTDSMIMACTACRAACLWSFADSWPPTVTSGLGTSGGLIAILLKLDEKPKVVCLCYDYRATRDRSADYP